MRDQLAKQSSTCEFSCLSSLFQIRSVPALKLDHGRKCSAPPQLLELLLLNVQSGQLPDRWL